LTAVKRAAHREHHIRFPRALRQTSIPVDCLFSHKLDNIRNAKEMKMDSYCVSDRIKETYNFARISPFISDGRRRDSCAN
jgi:hypothetical protein